jgi:hypothetical protein
MHKTSWKKIRGERLFWQRRIFNLMLTNLDIADKRKVYVTGPSLNSG